MEYVEYEKVKKVWEMYMKECRRFRESLKGVIRKIMELSGFSERESERLLERLLKVSDDLKRVVEMIFEVYYEFERGNRLWFEGFVKGVERRKEWKDEEVEEMSVVDVVRVFVGMLRKIDWKDEEKMVKFGMKLSKCVRNGKMLCDMLLDIEGKDEEWIKGYVEGLRLEIEWW